MSLTIVEAAKLNPGDVVRSAIVEMYARNSDILRVLPFENIAGNALKYNREDILPGIGFRVVNQGFTESVGVLNPVTESLVIAGGDLDVDRFITQTMGTNQCSVQEGLKVKALAHRWTLAFIKGDSMADPMVSSYLSQTSAVLRLEETIESSTAIFSRQSRISRKTVFSYSTSMWPTLKRLQI